MRNIVRKIVATRSPWKKGLVSWGGGASHASSLVCKLALSMEELGSGTKGLGTNADTEADADFDDFECEAIQTSKVLLKGQVMMVLCYHRTKSYKIYPLTTNACMSAP